MKETQTVVGIDETLPCVAGCRPLVMVRMIQCARRR